MGFPLFRLDRLRQRYEADQAGAGWQRQSSSLGSGFQRVQTDWQTRTACNNSYYHKLGDMSIGSVRNWQDV